MAINKLIELHAFGREIGRLGFDADKGSSSFQYHPDFLSSEQLTNMFPFIFKRTPMTQSFSQYNTQTFRGLPPMIADSLPDLFGNIIFKTWMETTNRNMSQVSVLEQLAYVGERGIGALEYQPSKAIASDNTISIEAIVDIVKQVLEQKENTSGTQLDHESLLNIFKIGTSAGGVRPKILISEHKETGTIVPGDIMFGGEYNHYLVKLGLKEDAKYSQELVEYSYYETATQVGINMMQSKMIDNVHFATLRFDRQNGIKKHVLTVTGLTGLDFRLPNEYERIFKLLIYLNCPHKDIEQLFRRMIFNLVFANHDDHLKNHSLIYDEQGNNWGLSPAYDLTYSLNPELNYKNVIRALSVNGKREDIRLSDVLSIAEQFTIKNPNGIITEIQDATTFWKARAKDLGISAKTIQNIEKNFAFIN